MAFTKVRIGIFGGTFNPVHNGHIQAAEKVIDKLGLTKLIFVPALNPPHKELPENSAPARMRLEMLRLATEGIKKAEVSDIEITRGGKSYTADTVSALKERYPDAEFWLLMGNDMYYSLESWKSFEWLLSNVSVCVVSRLNESEELEKYTRRYKDRYGINVVFADNIPLVISSTELRERLGRRSGREFLNPKVYGYIIKNRLYGAKPDFGWLRERAFKMLSPERIPHVLGCEEEAVKLAKLWGADVDDARSAAILHDITKNLDIKQQLLLCEKYVIMTDTVERQEIKLLHSITGAALAGDLFGMPDEVCSAIRWHTTGRAGMSKLEKIIYLADYIEPERDFDGVEDLRELTYRDLDAALLLGLEMSIKNIEGQGRVPHKNTISAIEYLKGRIKAR